MLLNIKGKLFLKLLDFFLFELHLFCYGLLSQLDLLVFLLKLVFEDLVFLLNHWETLFDLVKFPYERGLLFLFEVVVWGWEFVVIFGCKGGKVLVSVDVEIAFQQFNVLIKLLNLLLLFAYNLIFLSQLIEIIFELILIVHKQSIFTVDSFVQLWLFILKLWLLLLQLTYPLL